MAIKIRDGGAWVDIGSGGGSSSPIGSIIYYPSSSVPSGYLKANGASLNTTTYADLFAIVGYTFGGSGTTFSLPDLRGEFIRGWDDSRGIDSGRSLGSTQSSANLSHTHDGTTGNPNSSLSHRHQLADNVYSGFNSDDGVDAFYYYTQGDQFKANFQYTTYSGELNHTHNFTTNSDGGTESRPRNVALLACIKYQ